MELAFHFCFFNENYWIFIWTRFLWLQCAIILFQIEYVAILWLVSNTKQFKFHLQDSDSFKKQKSGYIKTV